MMKYNYVAQEPRIFLEIKNRNGISCSSTIDQRDVRLGEVDEYNETEI
jgi:hypothetical protein